MDGSGRGQTTLRTWTECLAAAVLASPNYSGPIGHETRFAQYGLATRSAVKGL